MDKEEFCRTFGAKFQSLIQKLTDEQQWSLFNFIKKLAPESQYQQDSHYAIFSTDNFDYNKLMMIYNFLCQLNKNLKNDNII